MKIHVHVGCAETCTCSLVVSVHQKHSIVGSIPKYMHIVRYMTMTALDELLCCVPLSLESLRSEYYMYNVLVLGLVVCSRLGLGSLAPLSLQINVHLQMYL